MAFRELTMIDVREVLRRWQAEQSERRIARETGLDRKTVGRYIHWAIELELPRDRALDDDDVHSVAECVQARPQRDASEEWREVAANKPRIEAWLGGKPPLRLSKIHTLLKRDGLVASYWTLRRFAMTELGWRKKEPTIRLVADVNYILPPCCLSSECYPNSSSAIAPSRLGANWLREDQTTCSQLAPLLDPPL